MNGEQDPLELAERLLLASDQGRLLQPLADAGRALLAVDGKAGPDPRRSRLVFDVANEFLRVATQQQRPDAIEAALLLVETEIARMIGRSDPASAALLVAMRGAVRDERYFVGHALDDLMGAIDDLGAATQMLEANPDLADEADRAWCWLALGRAMLRRAERSQLVEHLREAVNALDTAKALSGSATQQVQTGIVHMLAAARVELAERRLEERGSAAELDTAVDSAIADLGGLVLEEGATALDRAGWRQGLAVLLVRRMRRAGRTRAEIADDLTAGLQVVGEALGTLPSGDSGQVALLAVRADLVRAGHAAAEAVEEAMREVFTVAADFQHPEIVVAGANLATHYAARRRWPDIAWVGQRTSDVVDALVRRQVRDDYRWSIVRQSAGLPAVAAHALACEDRGLEAAVALERGQATVLSDRYLRPRQVHALLRTLGQEPLAEAYRTALSATRDGELPDHLLRRAEARLADVTRQVEAMPGVARLLRPVDEDVIAEATAGGTFAYLACGRYGGAVVVTDGTGAFAAEPIDDLTLARVVPIAARFARRVVAAANTPRLRARTIVDTCEWLGRFVLPHLERVIGDTTNPVTLIPTGRLTGLPLHAAAAGDGSPLARRRYTYSPSAMMTRAPAGVLDRGLPAVVVANPARLPSDDLPGTAREALTVGSVFARTRVLTGRGATSSAVTEAIRDAGILHFACHGVGFADDPVRSSLLLAGQDELQLADLLTTALDGVKLAVLSACQSAASDIRLPGESLNLSAGVLVSGAHAVIGSLWPVPDAATAALMDTFYGHLATGSTAPDALHAAQLGFSEGAVRPPWSVGREDWTNPYFWAGFVCLGQ